MNNRHHIMAFMARALNNALRGLWAIATLSMLLGYSYIAHATENEIDNYAAELARIDRVLQANIDFSSSRPESWIHLETVAQGYLKRAQLTGEFDDYIAADEAIKRAFELAGDAGGPVLTRARLNFSIHRLPSIERDLVKAESALLVGASTRQRIEGIRADVLFNTGFYSRAKALFDQQESSHPDVTTATRLAHYSAHIADFTEANRWFTEAEQRVTGQSSHLRSWIKLQFGILDLQQGRLDAAYEHYQDGLAIFPGFWLIEEHVAEIDALQGKTDIAETSYRELITRTGSPLFMGALSDILAESTDTIEQDESTLWRNNAVGVYETRIDKLPELISGHALEYFLQAGYTRRALKLAEKNYELRPSGPAQLLLVQTYSALGQLIKAVTLLDTLLDSPHRSAQLHATAGIVYRAAGEAVKAEQHDMLALAINPMAIDEVEWLKHKLDAAMNPSSATQ